MFSTKGIARAFLAVGLVLGIAAGPGFAENASHQGHEANHLVLSLNAGQKWRGDGNMFKGMEAIRAAIAAKVGDIHQNTLTDEGYKSLAVTVTRQTDFMIENCKLEPAVDEQFHIVLGQVIDGASEMEAGSAPRAGAVSIVQALNTYGDHFEHPGWQPLD